MIFHTLREWAFPWFRRHVSARSERLIYCNGAAIEWTVKHISGANNCCFLNRDEEVFVHLDRDGISYHPWLLLMLMAGAFALQGEAIPSEICSMLASIYIKIENTSADDAFILTLGTKHFFLYAHSTTGGGQNSDPLCGGIRPDSTTEGGSKNKKLIFLYSNVWVYV